MSTKINPDKLLVFKKGADIVGSLDISGSLYLKGNKVTATPQASGLLIKKAGVIQSSLDANGNFTASSYKTDAVGIDPLSMEIRSKTGLAMFYPRNSGFTWTKGQVLAKSLQGL